MEEGITFTITGKVTGTVSWGRLRTVPTPTPTPSVLFCPQPEAAVQEFPSLEALVTEAPGSGYGHSYETADSKAPRDLRWVLWLQEDRLEQQTEALPALPARSF